MLIVLFLPLDFAKTVFTMNFVTSMTFGRWGRNLRSLFDSPFPSHAQITFFFHATLQVLVFERESSIPILSSFSCLVCCLQRRSLNGFHDLPREVKCIVDICLSPFLLWGPLASGIVAPTFAWLLLKFLPASDGVDNGPYHLTSWFFFFVACLSVEGIRKLKSRV